MPEENTVTNEQVVERLDAALKLISDAQEVDKVQGEKGAEQIAKMQEDVGKNLAASQALEAKQKTIEDSVKNMEKIVVNMDEGNAGKSNNEKDEKAHKEFIQYLKRLTPISQESQKYVIEAMVEKSCYGLTDDEKAHQVKSLQVNVDPQGGYFVRPELSARMITRIFETSPMRQIATVDTTDSDSMEYYIDDEEAGGANTCETKTSGDETTPDVGLKTIFVHIIDTEPKATLKMINCATFNIEAWLQKKITKKFSRVQNRNYVLGAGHNSAKGFTTYPAWAVAETYERNKLERLISGSVGVVEGDDLKKLQGLLIEDYSSNATWVMRRKTFTNGVTLLKDNEDRYLLDPNSLKTGDTKILLGAPVLLFHDMADIATDTLPIAYGDFAEGYTILDKLGINVLRDPYTAKPFIKYYVSIYSGGDVTNWESIKILQIQ